MLWNRAVAVDSLYGVTFVFLSTRCSNPMIDIISQIVTLRISSFLFRADDRIIIIFHRIVFTLSNLKVRGAAGISQSVSSQFSEIETILINLVISQISMCLNNMLSYAFICLSRPFFVKANKIFCCQVCYRQIRIIMIISAQPFRRFAGPCLPVFVYSR